MTTYRLMDGASGRPGVGSSGTTPPTSPTAYSGKFQAGTMFSVTGEMMWLQGFYWWCPTGGDTGAQKFCLWNRYSTSAQVLVANTTVTSGTLTAGAWNYVALSTPVQLAPGALYVAATGWTSVHGFPDTNNQFGSGNPYAAGITNGPLTAWSDLGGSNTFGAATGNYGLNQGLFGTGSAGSNGDPTLNFPGGGSNSANFWIDVLVSDTAPAGYTGSYRFWPNVKDANNYTLDTANNFTLGMEFSLSQACTINNVWFYSPATVTQLPTEIGVYQVTGTSLVASNAAPSWSGAAASGWVSAAMGGSTVLAAGTNYKVVVLNGAGSPAVWNAAQDNYWSTGYGVNGLTSGPLTAPNTSSATSPGQDTYNAGATITYPNTNVATGYNYWLDIEVTPVTGSVPLPSGSIRGQLPVKRRGTARWSSPPATTVSNATVTGVVGQLTVTAPAGTVQAVTGSPGKIVQARTIAKPARARYPLGSQGTRGVSVSGPAGAITVAAAAGTITAVTGSPGMVIKARTVAKPSRGRYPAGSAGTTGIAVSGPAGAITVAALAGTVTAVTGSPGKLVRRQLPVPRRGIGTGATSVVSVPGIVTGTVGQVSVQALAGTVQAVTGSPGRAVRRQLPVPHRGTGTGIFAVTAAPGVVSGVPGQIIVSAPAGTVLAYTGSPGRVLRRPLPLPHRGAGRGTAGVPSLSITITGITGTVSIAAPAGTVQAVTGSPGKIVKPRPAPARGTTRGNPGLPHIGVTISGVLGHVTVTAPAGSISGVLGVNAVIDGVTGTVAVSAPMGFVVLVPYRYVNWRVRRGFAPVQPRSHIVHGNPGLISVFAPSGTVAILENEMGADAAGRIIMSRTPLPRRSGKSK